MAYTRPGGGKPGHAMSRLEAMIARLMTQRAYIGVAAGMIAHREGPVLEK